jgi:hypothetical protein
MYVLGYMKIYVLTVFVAAASDGTGKNMFLEGEKKKTVKDQGWEAQN